MYSFNFDFIFNVFYNILLAIRYVWLFWILRISKEQYLADHQNDVWDGLRDRGWISLENDSLSFSSFIKEKVFGIKESPNIGNVYGEDLSQINNSNFINNFDNLNSKNINLVLNKSDEPFFSNIHFSIQNSFLSFLADIITLLSFFIFLFFIYILLSWLKLKLGGNFKTNDEIYEDEKLKRKKIEDEKIKNKKVKHVFTFDEKLNYTEEQKLAKIKEIENELRLLEENEEMELEISKIENELNKNNLNNFENNEQNKIEDIGKKEIEKNLYQIKLKDWHNRWDIVQNYMTGGEEALWRIAILEADNLLNDILIDRGYIGDTVAEKLKNAKFRTIDLAWEAHKMRNRIAHDGSKFVLTERVARKTIAFFEAVLVEFKVLE